MSKEQFPPPSNFVCLSDSDHDLPTLTPPAFISREPTDDDRTAKKARISTEPQERVSVLDQEASRCATDIETAVEEAIGSMQMQFSKPIAMTSSISGSDSWWRTPKPFPIPKSAANSKIVAHSFERSAKNGEGSTMKPETTAAQKLVPRTDTGESTVKLGTVAVSRSGVGEHPEPVSRYIKLDKLHSPKMNLKQLKQTEIAELELVEQMATNVEVAKVKPETKVAPKPIPRTNTGESTIKLGTVAVSISGTDDHAEIVSRYVKLDELPSPKVTLTKLTQTEIAELELALQLDTNIEDEGWKDDWNGNLMLITKDISNPVSKRRKPGKSEWTQPLWEWAKIGGSNMRLARNLLAFVYHTKGTPPTAKRIFAHVSKQTEEDPYFDIFEHVKRVTYDPSVLREDGWTTAKSTHPEGASGGSFHIGKLVYWQGYDAVVIAYVHDDEFGDLWKAMWFEGFETFDLEAEELTAATKKWERRNKDKAENVNARSTAIVSTPSSRFAAASSFSVDGIEHGVVLATTYNPQARQGVFWPARIMHLSELDTTKSQNKRNASKGKICVVFLCPYWNSNVSRGKSSGPGTFADSPLFEMEAIEVSEQAIQKYTYDGENGLNIRQLRGAFRFTGLPNHLFSRFLNSHRLALALKTYAQSELKVVRSHQASAALFDTHILAVHTAQFPPALLHLPFNYLLSKLPVPDEEKSASQEVEDKIEPVLKLTEILNAMAPPRCWGQEDDTVTPKNGHISKVLKLALTKSPTPRALAMTVNADNQNKGTKESPLEIETVASHFLFEELTNLSTTECSSASLLDDLSRILSRIGRVLPGFQIMATNEKAAMLSTLLHDCLRLKARGEDIIVSENSILENGGVLKAEWRKCCERIFRFITISCSSEGFGNGVTVVQSDSRCNEHITGNCVERSVRLPAALKGARMAGAGKSASFILTPSIEDHYIDLAENHVINKAHCTSYLKRMKSRCLALAHDSAGEALTADSDGNGGGDTNGSRGTWQAAIAGVAVALKAVDMIVGGACVNAFCATRPPGHHAGRGLHAMTAVSNGFCILNPAACAAIYATAPQSEGGMGLKRVCVLDWDVHHGNGTQDILCATHDPRFLYISLHAGGPLINGYDTDDSDNFDDNYRKGGSSKKLEGIFPGRCGDTSPHRGVLNIPLGARVTPNDVGNALLSQVEPAIEEFAPDLIILSAGFDAHKNDPLGMGGLSALDFGHITELACAIAFKCCSGRVMSIMEGGYGVPCCRPQTDTFLPSTQLSGSEMESKQNTDDQFSGWPSGAPEDKGARMQPSKLADLGTDLPANMDDQVQIGLQKRLEKCHQEGFIDCVREHVLALKKNNNRCN